MKKIILVVLMAIVICLVGVAFALSTYDLVSSTSVPENGAITIAFDDGPRLCHYQIAWPLMRERGMVGTLYVVSNWIKLGPPLFGVGAAELLEMQNDGWEMASHSVNHPDFTALSESEIRYQCASSKEALESYGLTIDNFAYPYGASNPDIDSIVDDYYRSGRYDLGIMQFPVTTFKVLGLGAEGDKGFPFVKQFVDEVYEQKGWGIIFFHAITTDVSEVDGETIFVEDFVEFLDYVLLKLVAVITVNQGLDIGAPAYVDFSGSISVGGLSLHSFAVPADAIKVVARLEMPGGTDFDLSLWDNLDRRTGGWIPGDPAARTSIPNSQYSGYLASPESIVVEPPATNGTWKVGCYAYTGSGTYKITIRIYLP